MGHSKRIEIPLIGENEVLLPPLQYDDGPHYFWCAAEQAAYLCNKGYSATKLVPDAPEGMIHCSFGIDFNGVMVSALMLAKDGAFQLFLGVLGNYLYDKLKGGPTHDKHGREFVPKIQIVVQRPDKTTVSIHFTGDASEWQDFCKADHAKLFSAAAATGIIDAKGAKYVALHVRDVFHYPNCKHIRDNLEEGVSRELIGFASAQAAVHERRRPCKYCKPPWND